MVYNPHNTKEDLNMRTNRAQNVSFTAKVNILNETEAKKLLAQPLTTYLKYCGGKNIEHSITIEDGFLNVSSQYAKKKLLDNSTDVIFTRDVSIVLPEEIMDKKHIDKVLELSKITKKWIKRIDQVITEVNPRSWRKYNSTINVFKQNWDWPSIKNF